MIYIKSIIFLFPKLPSTRIGKIGNVQMNISKEKEKNEMKNCEEKYHVANNDAYSRRITLMCILMDVRYPFNAEMRPDAPYRHNMTYMSYIPKQSKAPYIGHFCGTNKCNMIWAH